MLTRENGFTLPWRFPLYFDRKAVIAFVFLCATLFMVYSNSFRGEWHFDDFHNIVDNRNVQIQGLSWEELKKTIYVPAFKTDSERVSRPLAYISFALNYYFGGTDVLGYHIVNFAVHLLASFFLFLLIRLTLSLPTMRERYGSVAYAIALLSTFLWATSPLHVNAVTIIVQRMTSLAGLAYVSCLYFYARARTAESKQGRAALFVSSCLCALAAFATKENTAVLPIAVLLYDLFFVQGISSRSMKGALKGSFPAILVVIGLGLLYTDFSLQRATYEIGVRPFTPAERLLTEGRILFFYVSLLLYPIPSRLTLLHDIDISRSLFDPWTTLASLAGILLCLLFAGLKAKKHPLVSYAILFFILNHLVEGTLIPLELIFEHRNYIPAMFFFVPIASGIIGCLDYFSYKKGVQFFIAGGLALLLSFQGYTTFERNDIVRSDTHLWLDNVQKSPGLSRPHINLARHYYEAGMYEQAYEELKTAEELNRDTNLQQIGLASQGLGLYYLYQKKDLERAKHQFEKALERLPRLPAAIVGLATVALAKGNIDEAWQLMQAYAPRHQSDQEMTTIYALVLLKKGDPQGAIKAAANAMALKEDEPQPWEISGEAWRQLGQWQKAAQCWEKALRLNPLNSRATLALLEIYDHLKEGPAQTRMAVRCLALKGEAPLDTWLKDLARNSSLSAYEVNPERLGRIIRREVGRELKRQERVPLWKRQ